MTMERNDFVIKSGDYAAIVELINKRWNEFVSLCSDDEEIAESLLNEMKNLAGMN